jgi:hypothetical protein
VDWFDVVSSLSGSGGAVILLFMEFAVSCINEYLIVFSIPSTRRRPSEGQ